VSSAAALTSIRRQAFGAVVLICLQAGLGMFMNLFVSIPERHSGAQPSDFFGGSTKSVAWAITHGALTLVVHTVLGLVLALMVIGMVAKALSIGRRALTAWTILGALFTVGAGFNGASFLDYHKDVSSFIMTILALAALLCFMVVVYLPCGSNTADGAQPARPSGTESD
jgi:hypothetical protein